MLNNKYIYTIKKFDVNSYRCDRNYQLHYTIKNPPNCLDGKIAMKKCRKNNLQLKYSELFNY